MTEYEQFIFDLKGFLVIPGVLTPAETADLRDHLATLASDRESLPAHHQAPMGASTLA